MVDITEHRENPELQSQLGCGSANANDISNWIFIFLSVSSSASPARLRMYECRSLGMEACFHHGSVPARIRETLESRIILILFSRLSFSMLAVGEVVMLYALVLEPSVGRVMSNGRCQSASLPPRK